MATRLLSEAEMASLLAQPPEACAALLAQAGLSGLAAEMEAGRSVEQSIIAVQLADILILLRAAGAGRGFLKYWTLRFEMSNLKAIIRSRMNGAAAAPIRSELSGLGFLARLPVEALLQTEDIGELLRRLEATPYADMVRFARRAFEARPRLFDLDAALDRRFYHGLAEQARALEKRLGEPFRRILEAHLDRVNLTWLLRFRFVYRLPPAQVYYLLIPSRYRLSSGVLKELATLREFGEVLAALPEPYRALLAGADGIEQAAATLDRHYAATARSVLHSGAPAFARAFAYLVLRDRDLRRVRAVLKGRSLGLAAATIAQAAGLAGAPLPEAA